jgi:hypothetical protein
MIDESETKPDEHWTWPLLVCLSDESFSALKTAAWRNHHKRLLKTDIWPFGPPDLLPFDADREIRRAPSSEAHMRGS